MMFAGYPLWPSFVTCHKVLLFLRRGVLLHGISKAVARWQWWREDPHQGHLQR